jgi:2-polyprenyl-6-methoxyphenol hydroxylase-like FAD-dependent oxidoreductase
MSSFPPQDPIEFLIVGGGMGGLVLALGLNKFCGIRVHVVDQAPGFGEGVGGAIGMYANGLQVIRDIDPKLLQSLRDNGYDYLYRRWYRHDGTEVACADEGLLIPSGGEQHAKELVPLGIRRWKLQKALYDACVEAGILIHFNHAVKQVVPADETGDGDSYHSISFWNHDYVIRAKYVFGADGVKSRVREAVVGGAGKEEPTYTGVTCLMGSSKVPRPVRGICFPSSVTTKCHMCTYPTADDESIFQIYFPTPVENPDEWGLLSPEQERKECTELADRLTKDGWHEQFVQPLREATPGSVVRVGLRAREPVSTWTKGTLVLLGDAAHPPGKYGTTTNHGTTKSVWCVTQSICMYILISHVGRFTSFFYFLPHTTTVVPYIGQGTYCVYSLVSLCQIVISPHTHPSASSFLFSPPLVVIF